MVWKHEKIDPACMFPDPHVALRKILFNWDWNYWLLVWKNISSGASGEEPRCWQKVKGLDCSTERPRLSRWRSWRRFSMSWFWSSKGLIDVHQGTNQRVERWTVWPRVWVCAVCVTKGKTHATDLTGGEENLIIKKNKNRNSVFIFSQRTTHAVVQGKKRKDRLDKRVWPARRVA